MMLLRVPHYLILVAIALCCAVTSEAGETRSEMSAAVELEAKKGKYRLIDVDTLWQLYQDASQDILLVDTRQEWEFRTGHLEGSAHFSMEPTWFERLIQRHALAQALGPDKDRTLVFY